MTMTGGTIATNTNNNKSFATSPSSSYHGLVRTNSIALWQAETVGEQVGWIVAGCVAGCAVCAFALRFPLFLFPHAARPTYLPAGYSYDPALSHFDNTIWTYGTDYMIAVAMMVQIYKFPPLTAQNAILQRRAKALLASYALSVTVGGVCHQWYTHVEDRQAWHFRVLWTLCVGSVTAGVSALGAIGTELVRVDEGLGLACVPALPGWFWASVGTACTAACAAGWFSFQRPACDIFVAGVAQSVPTFYLMALLARGLPTFALDRPTRYIGLTAFIMMSATLPTYPLAVQYTDWSLGTINAALHVWLTVAWSAQGWTLRKIAVALAAEGPKQCIPVKRVKAA